MKILIIFCFNIIISNVFASYLISSATYPNFSAQTPILPQPYRNYFSLDGNTAGLIRNIIGPNIVPETLFNHEPFRTTIQPTWTRPTTPKDILIEYIERTLDKLLTSNYQSEISSIDKNSIEADSLIINTNKKLQTISNNETEEEIEGSGEEKQNSKLSSISGIPNIFPNISKVPLDFRAGALIPTPTKLGDVESIIKNFKLTKPNVPEGGLGPLLQESNIRRHPGNSTKYSPKTVEKFEYGLKPTYKQGLINSALHFLGIHGNSLDEDNLSSELDRVLTEWLLQHSPTYQTKAEKNANIESSYNTFQKFIAHSVMPLCNPQPESIQNFNVQAFMGQWFQVMYSPLISLSSCSMMNYKMLSETLNGIGSTFQTLEYSVPRLDDRSKKRTSAIMSSGYAMVSRPGQLIYHKSNSPEDDFVHVIHVSDSPMINGRYEYAVLSVNCNYPLYVIARDPDVFQQKYARTVNAFLQRKGLINQVSRLLSIIKPVDFSKCILPPNLFGGIQ